MKKIVGSLLRMTVFWVVFFNLARLTFIIYHVKLLRVENIPFTEVLGIFYYSFRLDLATACYVMVVPFLLLVVQSIQPARWINVAQKVYASLLILAYSLSAAGEMGIYSEWKTKLTYKVVKYFMHPSEIYNSAETSTFFFLVFLFLLLAFTGIFLFTRFFYSDISETRRSWLFSAGFLLLTPGFLFLGMRGGTREIPINQSQSYFSGFNILNVASVNNAFNLYISIFENLRNFDRNPYVFMDQAQAARIVEKIYEFPKDTTVRILTTTRPNIVVLIMESWSADLIESLGGKTGITPEFKALEKEGILFDRMWSAGARSEQGMASIFGGFPAHPVSSSTVQPDKYPALPSLPKNLEKAGYSTAFYFGGQLIYGNIKGYIYFNGFDKIMEGENFPDSLPRGKLGIHDQFTLGYLARDLGTLREPFFASLFTVSTHSPWDQPYPKPLKWGDNEQEYINGALYTDHCLGNFFREVRTKPWYANTLFIIVADHSHNSYYNWHPNTREYHRIPMLFVGGSIKPEFRGTRWSKMGNHHDLPAIISAQLELPANEFRWSKNLFNPYAPDFAYFTNEDGAGWIRPGVHISYDVGVNMFYAFEAPEQYRDSLLGEAHAYLQVLFDEYLRQ